MPTTGPLPIPAAMLPAGPLNPYDWIDLGGGDGSYSGGENAALQRGTPGGLAPYQQRQIRGPGSIAQGVPLYLQSRPYSRGAQAFSPKFGLLTYNPIGAGIPVPYKLPIIAGPGARYELGAIWFDVQAIPTSMEASPTISTETLDALLASSSVAAMYPTTG